MDDQRQSLTSSQRAEYLERKKQLAGWKHGERMHKLRQRFYANCPNCDNFGRLLQLIDNKNLLTNGHIIDVAEKLACGRYMTVVVRLWRAEQNPACYFDESPVRFYAPCHASASLLLMAGVNVKVVAERLGHADIRVTLDTYSHVMHGMQEAAADAFDDVLTKPKSGKAQSGRTVVVQGGIQGPQTLDAPTEVEAS